MKVFDSVPGDALLAESEDISWVVRPFLMRGSALMIYGRQGVGKSTLAFQLACALSSRAEERLWLDFPVTARGTVLWLQLDMPKGEMRALIHRAVRSGLWKPGQRVELLRMREDADGPEVFDFNVLRARDYEGLMEVVQRVRPVAVVIDTAGDVYEASPTQNVNDQIRLVLRRLRNALRSVGGVLVYLHHQRKRHQLSSGDDEDAFLGGVAWEGFATTSLQIQRRKRYKTKDDDEEDDDDRFVIKVRKARIERPPFEEFVLRKNEHGFFVPEWSARQALLMWPWCVPSEARNGDIMAALSRHLSLSENSLRIAKTRLKQQGLEISP